MDIRTLLQAEHDLYRTRLAGLAAELEAEHRVVEPEVPFIVEDAEPLERVRIVDYVVAEDEGTAPRAVELGPGPVIGHPPLAFAAGGVDLLVRGLAWDRVHLDPGPLAIPDDALGPVLARWQWDAAAEALPDALGHIHSIRRVDNGIVVDLGTGSYSGNSTFSPLRHLRYSYGVTSLAGAVITHPHADHIADIFEMDDLKKDITYLIGRIYEGAKKKDKARNEYEKIAEVDFNYKDVTTRIEALSDEL